MFRSGLVISVSGWVPNVKPGTKCLHGVYIPSTQEDQGFADYCDVCKSLINFMNFTNLTLPEIEQRTRLIWTRLASKKEE